MYFFNTLSKQVVSFPNASLVQVLPETQVYKHPRFQQKKTPVNGNQNFAQTYLYSFSRQQPTDVKTQSNNFCTNHKKQQQNRKFQDSNKSEF
jgi:hypothetical protein